MRIGSTAFHGRILAHTEKGRDCPVPFGLSRRSRCEVDSPGTGQFRPGYDREINHDTVSFAEKGLL
jgi:hypothetical protein